MTSTALEKLIEANLSGSEYKACLTIMTAGPAIPLGKFAQITGMNHSSLCRVLRSLESKGMLIRQGESGKVTHYFLAGIVQTASGQDNRSVQTDSGEIATCGSGDSGKDDTCVQIASGKMGNVPIKVLERETRTSLKDKHSHEYIAPEEPESVIFSPETEKLKPAVQKENQTIEPPAGTVDAWERAFGVQMKPDAWRDEALIRGAAFMLVLRQSGRLADVKNPVGYLYRVARSGPEAWAMPPAGHPAQSPRTLPAFDPGEVLRNQAQAQAHRKALDRWDALPPAERDKWLARARERPQPPGKDRSGMLARMMYADAAGGGHGR